MTTLIINNYYKPKNRNKVRQIIEALRECGERDCELKDYRNIPKQEIKGKYDAVILSGSSAHLGDPEHLSWYEEEIKLIQRINVPLLGICFGHQLIGKAFGSEIESLPESIKGFGEVEILEPDEIFSSWKRGEKITVCQSHQDYVASLPSDFICLAKSESCEIEAMKHNYKLIYGVQAHIERVSEERVWEEYYDGWQILKNFFKNVVKKMEVNYKQLLEGSEEYIRREKRDSMYKVATFLISQPWTNASWAPSIAEGLGVLLLTWNQAFYRYGSFDFDKLEDFMNRYGEVLEQFRKRDIFSFNKSDEKVVKELFNELLNVLSVKDKKGNTRRSPVAVSKALHLLAPKFFPLWDDDIAKAEIYRCYWSGGSSQAPDRYLKFMSKIKQIAKQIVREYSEKKGVDEKMAVVCICNECSKNIPFTKSLLKIIDEYNYAKFSQHWIT